MARGRVLVRPGKKIDFKSWTAIPSVQEVIITDSTVSGAGLAFSEPATILRCRGEILVHLEATLGIGDSVKFGFGLGVISSDAFTLGATAMPDPSGDADYPWVYWTEITLGSESVAVEQASGIQNLRIPVDSKAMRKMKPAETFCWIIQRTDLGGNPPAVVDIAQTRVLIGT